MSSNPPKPTIDELNDLIKNWRNKPTSQASAGGGGARVSSPLPPPPPFLHPFPRGSSLSSRLSINAGGTGARALPPPPPFLHPFPRGSSRILINAGGAGARALPPPPPFLHPQRFLTDASGGGIRPRPPPPPPPPPRPGSSFTSQLSLINAHGGGGGANSSTSSSQAGFSIGTHSRKKGGGKGIAKGRGGTGGKDKGSRMDIDDDVRLKGEIIDYLKRGYIIDVVIEYPNAKDIQTKYYGKIVGITPSNRMLISTTWREYDSSLAIPQQEEEHIQYEILDLTTNKITDTIKRVLRRQKVIQSTPQIFQDTDDSIWKKISESKADGAAHHTKKIKQKTAIVRIDAKDSSKEFKLETSAEKIYETVPVHVAQILYDAKEFQIVKGVTPPSIQYTKAPHIEISAPPRNKDYLQAIVSCVLSRGELKIKVLNPGLYPTGSAIEATFFPQPCDIDKLPTSISICPFMDKEDAEYKKDPHVHKCAYELDATIYPDSHKYPRRTLSIVTIGWFSDITKYTSNSFDFMLDYTFKIANEMKVDQIILDDQSYMPIKGFQKKHLDSFNRNPTQQRQLVKFHPPFNKVLLPLSKGLTYYTMQGFTCLPVLIFTEADKLININPSRLTHLVGMMRYISLCVGSLIKKYAQIIRLKHLEIGQEKKEAEPELKSPSQDKKRAAPTQLSSKKRSKTFTMDNLSLLSTQLQGLTPNSSLFQAATRFRQVFKKLPKMDEDVMLFYNDFSRKVFTYNKRFVRDIKGTEEEYFRLYIDIFLKYVHVEVEPHTPPITAENFLQLMPRIKNFTIPRPDPVKEEDIPEILNYLRILLWGYNSVFSSTRMYRTGTPFIRKKRPDDGSASASPAVSAAAAAGGGGGGVFFHL